MLVCDNEEPLRALVIGALELGDYEIVEAHDGDESVELARACDPDLIVLDIHLPGLRGDELLAEMSQRPETRQIPAIVVTGADIDLAVAQAKQILRKPCDPERLVSVVERYVEAAA